MSVGNPLCTGGLADRGRGASLAVDLNLITAVVDGFPREFADEISHIAALEVY